MSNDIKFEDGKLIYPCEWIYKVIGENAIELEKELISLFSEKKYTLKESNKKGKYTAFSLKIKVKSELERDAIHIILKDSPLVKIVL